MLRLIILPPILFNLNWIVDTYLTKLLGKQQKAGVLESSTETLMIIGGMLTFLAAIVLFCCLWTKVFTIGLPAILSITFAGIFYGFASFPYFEALKKEKIENIMPMYQTIPIFTYLVASLVLGETMSPLSILLMVVIVGITTLFSRNFKEKKFNNKGLVLILASALLYALCFVSFKFWGESVDNIRISYFREHIGVSLISLAFLLRTKTRTTTFQYFKQCWMKFTLLNAGNEVSYTIGIFFTNYLTLFFNVAFIETIIDGLQPVLGFLMVFLAYKLFPRIYVWKYSRKELLWKYTLCWVTFLLLFIFYHIT